jgi:hypothetical protein
MKRFTCPICSKQLAQRDLLARPPSMPKASRAPASAYCPACSGEVRVSSDLHWPQVLAFVALLALMAVAVYFTDATSNLAWVRPFVFPVFFLGLLAVSHSARRLVAVQT